MTVSYPPICVSCSHILPKRNGLMSCEAFEIIPGMVVFNRLDHRLPVAGDNEIQFEQHPDRPVLDEETYDAIFKAVAASPMFARDAEFEDKHPRDEKHQKFVKKVPEEATDKRDREIIEARKWAKDHADEEEPDFFEGDTGDPAPLLRRMEAWLEDRFNAKRPGLWDPMTVDFAADGKMIIRSKFEGPLGASHLVETKEILAPAVMVMKELSWELGRLAREFPEVASLVDSVVVADLFYYDPSSTSQGYPRVWAHWDKMGGGAIRFDLSWVSHEFDFRDAMVNDYDSGWHVSPTLAGVANHEFGHVVASKLGIKGPQWYWPGVGGPDQTDYSPPGPVEIAHNTYWGDYNHRFPLSTYADTGSGNPDLSPRHEFAAELFSSQQPTSGNTRTRRSRKLRALYDILLSGLEESE